MLAVSRFNIALLAVLCAVGAPAVFAQDRYPSKPIRVVNPNSAVSSQALFTRILMKTLEPHFGQSVVIDSRPGGNSTIGVVAVLKSPPDGYTLLVTTSTPLVGARAFLKNIPYDPINDVTGVIVAYNSAFVMMVRNEEKGTTFAQLLEKMRRDPDKYALGGTSPTTMLLNTMLASAANLKHVYVPYITSIPQIADLLGGRIGVMFHAPNLSLPMVRGNQAHAMAVGGNRRMKPLPNTPTMSETLPGVELSYWLGYFAPAKTPKAIIDYLHPAFVEALKHPEAIEYMENSGSILTMPPEQIHDFMVKEDARWLRLTREAGIKPE